MPTPLPTQTPPETTETSPGGGSRRRWTAPPMVQGMLTVFLVLTLCGTAAWAYSWYAAAGKDRAEQHSKNQDPRRGTVRVFDDESLFKRCDGGTLLYWSGSGIPSFTSTVAGSAECR